MGGGGGGLLHFSVSPRPLGFGFGTKGFGAKGLGPGLDNTDTEYIRFLRIVRIPNTEYIRFLKMIEYRIPNSTIQMLLLLVSILRVLIGISLSLTASVSGL